jgi:hypothetical protein
MWQNLWQILIVAGIVAAALVHASTRYLPAGWRRRIAAALGRHGGAAAKAAAWYAPKAGCGGGCSSCSSSAPGSGGAAAACGSAKPGEKTEHVIKLHMQPRQ